MRPSWILAITMALAGAAPRDARAFESECEGDICHFAAPPSEAQDERRVTPYQGADGDVYVLDCNVAPSCDQVAGYDLCPDPNYTGYYEWNAYETVRRFYRDVGGDAYDTLVVWMEFPHQPGAGAYWSPISNDVTGINSGSRRSRYGQPETFNNAAYYGSDGRLRGLVVMKALYDCQPGSYYGCSPEPPFPETSRSVLSVLGQEVGHQWGAFVTLPGTGAATTALLGRSQNHWSYHLDTGASPLEGNSWAHLPPDRFLLQPSYRVQFSPLDQYLMGLRPPEEVPPFLLITAPTPQSRLGASEAPEEGETQVRGDPRWINISQVIQGNGPRRPAFADATKVSRQAWLFLHRDQWPSSAFAAHVEAIRGLQKAWPPVYHRATEGRGRALTTLAGADTYPVWSLETDADLHRPDAHTGWKIAHATHEVANGSLALRGQATPSLSHDGVRLEAREWASVEITLALPEGALGPARLLWEVSGQSGTSSLEFYPVADGTLRTYALALPSTWRGTILSLGLAPAEQLPHETPPAEIRIAHLEFSPRLPRDRDGDTLADESDVCPGRADPDQTDGDGDGLGDACDPDLDADGILDDVDLCPGFASPNQADSDADGIGNVCDDSPHPPPPEEPAIEEPPPTSIPTAASDSGCASASGASLAAAGIVFGLARRRRAH